MNNLIETYQNIIEQIKVDDEDYGVFYDYYYKKEPDAELYFYYIMIYAEKNNYNIDTIITNDVFLKNGKSKFSEQLNTIYKLVIDEDNIWTDEYAKRVAKRIKDRKYIIKRCDAEYNNVIDIFRSN